MQKARRGITKTVGLLVALVIVFASVAAVSFLNPTNSQGVSTTTLTSTISGATTTISGATTTKTVTGGTSASPDLIAAAKAEGGSLVIYTTLSDAPMKYLISRFNQLYPWATVTYLASDQPGIYTKVSAEAQSNKHTADLVSSSPGLTGQLVQANLVENYSNPMISLMQVPQSALLLPGATPVDFQYYSVAINTKLVTPSQIPKNWTDLGNQIWKGKIAMDSPSRLAAAGAVLYGLYPVLGNASWTTLMHQIEANQPTLYNSGTDSQNALVNGQAALLIGIPPHAYATAVAAGAPIQWVWLAPTPAAPFYYVIVNGAPHEYTARLWLQWISSVDGQLAIQNTGVPSVTAVIRDSNQTNVAPGVHFNYISEIYTNPTKWQGIFTSLFPPA